MSARTMAARYESGKRSASYAAEVNCKLLLHKVCTHTPLPTHRPDEDRTERDHILGMSFSPRLYFTHISIWTKQGNNLRSILLLERAIVEGLSPDLRPRSNTEFNYRKHVDKLGLNIQGQENQIPPLPPMTTSRPVLLRAMTAG